MKKVTLAAIPLILLVAGCTSVNQSAPSSFTGPATSGCLHYETKVGAAISGESSVTRILGFIRLGDTEFADGVAFGTSSFSLGFSDADDAKSAAAYKAIKKSGADTIVAPKYVLTQESFFGIYKTTHAKVSGLEGSISNFNDCRTLPAEFVSANKK